MQQWKKITAFMLLVMGLLVWLAPVSAAPQAGGKPLNVTLAFSTDAGKTWQAQPPQLEVGGKFIVKATWRFKHSSWAHRGVMIAWLISPQCDFASANRGRKNWQPHGWYQWNSPQYWFSPWASGVRMTVSLGVRQNGVMGSQNRWDTQKGHFVDAPLPACRALPDGEYPFILRLTYNNQLPANPLKINVDMPFTVVVGSKGQPRVGASQAVQAYRTATAGPVQPSRPGVGYVIYVAPDGKDTNSGRENAPLATLARAVGIAGTGDVIILRGGTYRLSNSVHLTQSGTAGKPFTIEAAPGAKVVLKGSRVVKGWQAAGDGLWKVDHWPIDSQQLFMDGKPLLQIGIQSPWNTKKLWANHVTLPPHGQGLGDVKPGCFYYQAATRSLYCMLPDRSNPNQHHMEASVADSLVLGAGASHVKIKGLTFMDSNGTAKGQTSALLGVYGSSWTVEDCTFAYGDFAGIELSGENHIIRRCRLLNNGCEGLSGNGSNAADGWRRLPTRPPQHILLEDLVVRGNNYRGFFADWGAGGMKLIPSMHDVTVHGCQVEDNHGPGIWFDSDFGDITITDNLVRDNSTGIFYEVSMPLPGDRYGALIRNNRVIANKHQGIYISASRNAIVENNTCYHNAWDIVVHGMPRYDFGHGPLPLKDDVVKNNIVDGLYADIIIFSGVNAGHNTVDGNFYASISGDKRRGPAVGVETNTAMGYRVAYFNLHKLFSTRGFEAHGLAGNPQWLDAGAGNFRLRAGSPAQGKGWQSHK